MRLFSPKAIAITCLFIVFQSYAIPAHAQSQSPSLQLNNISFNAENSGEINQIVFAFNQNIAILGALPSQSQINSVIMSHGLSQYCRWRFVKLSMLACELSEALPLFIEVDISLNDSFYGLNKQIDLLNSKVTASKIVTELPEMRLQTSRITKHFPSMFFTNFYIDKTQQDWPNQLALHKAMLSSLRLKTPSGDFKTLQYSIERKRDDYARSKITILFNAEQLQDGLYQIIIPKGFTPSIDEKLTGEGQYRTLANDEVLYEFSYSRDFKFYGIACKSVNHDYSFMTQIQGSILKCPPEKFVFVFSRKLFQAQENNMQASWLLGPEYIKAEYAEKNNSYYYGFELQGNSEYRLSLAGLKSDEGLLIKQQEALSFTTPDATSEWYLRSRQLDVVESDRETPLYFSRRNVADMKRGLVAIQSAEDLQSYLNSKRKSDAVHTKSKFVASEDTKNKAGAQALGFRQALTQASGLVEVSLEGSHNNVAVHFTDDGLPIFNAPTEIKKSSFIANSAAFNLAVWQHSNLLVQAIDWEANGLANANVSLVCEGNLAPLRMGYTSNEGLLFVPTSRWSELYISVPTKACWLWASSKKGSAAIQLRKPQVDDLSKPKMMAFTAQPIYEPGDTVHLGIVAKQREEAANSSQRILPMANLDNYSVQIMRPNSDDVHTQLNMSALTINGLTSASFTFEDTDSVGNYPIVIKHMHNNETDYVGDVTLVEFSPPEFEQSLKLPQKTSSSPNIQARINRGESLKAVLSARRLNGGTLVNAKVSTRYQITGSYTAPEIWPQGYTFTSYDEFKQHHKALNKTNNFILDETGTLNFESLPIQSELPIAKIVFESTVSTDDGETQFSQDSVLYLSRSHYIGTKVSDDGEHLALIGLTKDGIPLNDIMLAVEFFKPDSANRGEWISINICKLDSLPNQCKVPILDTQLRAKITSGSQQYDWIRSVYAFSKKVPSAQLEYPNLEFVLADTASMDNTENQRRFGISSMVDGEGISAAVGEQLNVNLSSNVAGMATFIVIAGNIQKVWQQPLLVGSNTVVLPIEQAWIPAAKVLVSLPVDRQVTDALAEALLQDAASNSEKPSRISEFMINSDSSELGKFRLLSASINVAVLPKELSPEVTIVPEWQQAMSGSELSITLQSNTEVDTQLWLVNDGILAMAGFNIEDIDPASFYLYEAQLDNRAVFHSLAQRLLTEKGLLETKATNKLQYSAHSEDLEGISVTGSRLRSERNGLSQGARFTKKDFAQSLWVDTLRLKPNTPQIINIKLPQLIGRWKIIAMNVTQDQSSMSSVDLTTIKSLEYFLDSPTAIFENDRSNVAITQINNTSKATEDELTLWIDGEVSKRVNVTLGAAGAKSAYRRIQVDLPALPAGKHTVHLTSRADESFAAYAELMVLPSNISKQTAWLVGSNNSSLVAPLDILANSLSLSTVDSGGDTPNWQQLTQYNQDYQHVGWEQTISRAVSYAYSDKSKTQWPDGTKVLNQLLKKQSEYTNGIGQYSYFQNTPDDAFLTAYTFLVHAWLKDSSTPLLVDVDIAIDTLREYLTLTQNNRTSSVDKSMALLALAKNKSISLDEALIMRQKIGSSGQGDGANSLVLQALALKLLGANHSLYQDILSATINNKYIDTNTSIFNQNSYKCFAALAYDNNSEEHASLVYEVVNQQQQEGHFGSTFANAVCSYLLQGNTAEQPESALVFSVGKDKLNYTYDTDSNYWLRLKYMQNIGSIAEASAGLSVSRSIMVKRGDKWINTDESTLIIGDLIKTEILVDTPIGRQHIAITDSIAGGFEAINPARQNERYGDYFDYSWFRANNVQIRNGKAFWYINRLHQGQNSFVYFSRVRHMGEFTIAPVQIEAIYRTDIYANSQSKRISVK